jgi:hypothetical protein
VFQAALELSLIPIPIDPGMDPIAVGLAELPLADIGVTSGSAPHAGTVLQAVDPLSLVELAVGPEVCADPFGLAIDILSVVLGAIGKLLVALAVLEVGLPLALVQPAVVVHHHSFAVTFAVEHLAVEHALLVALELEQLGLVQVVDREVRLRAVLLEVLHEGLRGHRLVN